MTASSGQSGVCSNAKCGHWNNEHNSYKCKETNCRKRWKVCQTGDHGVSGKYALCAKCPDHPAGGPDGFDDIIKLIFIGAL
ncbi:unnamed protein product [Penicillium pancosmium]